MLSFPQGYYGGCMSTHVGIDVSKDELVVHTLPSELSGAFPNNSAGLIDLLAWLLPLD